MITTNYYFDNILVTRVQLDDEENVRLARLKAPHRENAQELYIYTKGKCKVTCENDSNFLSMRETGWCSKDNYPEPRGIYNKKFEGNSEWWCINYQKLKNIGLDVEKIHVKANQNISLNESKYVFFVGELKIESEDIYYCAPFVLNLTKRVNAIASSETVGYRLIKINEVNNEK